MFVYNIQVIKMMTWFTQILVHLVSMHEVTVTCLFLPDMGIFASKNMNFIFNVSELYLDI